MDGQQFTAVLDCCWRGIVRRGFEDAWHSNRVQITMPIQINCIDALLTKQILHNLQLNYMIAAVKNFPGNCNTPLKFYILQKYTVCFIMTFYFEENILCQNTFGDGFSSVSVGLGQKILLFKRKFVQRRSIQSKQIYTHYLAVSRIQCTTEGVQLLKRFGFCHEGTQI